ncbi:TPA: arabinofuranosidase catalytic domain-containing protein, partial [Klebsiella oxytoca]
MALSLRQLSASYTGPAIRVRRSSDNTEINIGFTAEGDLDTTALLNFCGSGNGFISVWYDQSGNEFNAIRENVSGQPRIVSAGAVDLIGSKPGVVFDGTSDALSLTAAVSALSGVASLSSSLVLRFRSSPAAACSIFSFYKSDSPVRRRYNLGAGFQSQAK